MNKYQHFSDSLGISNDALRDLEYWQVLVTFSILNSDIGWETKKDRLYIVLKDKANAIIEEVEKNG